MPLVMELGPFPELSDDRLADVVARQCTKCGSTKALSEFARKKTGRFGRRADCKDCYREYQRQWRVENVDRKREYQRQWRVENADRRRAYHRQWYAGNADRVREYVRQWGRANPDKVRDKTARRRARKLNAQTIPYTRADIARAWDEAGMYECWYCDLPLYSDVDVHLDHVIPLSRGGADAPENLVWACASCNLRKNAKTAAEFEVESVLDLE